jgi:hypothetical protein
MADVTQAAMVGRTRWRRFGVAAGAGLGAVGIVGYLAATGALALSFAFSGIPFSLTADSLNGTGFVQYAFPDRVASGDAADALGAASGAVVGRAPINNTATVGGTTFVSDSVTQFRSATIGGLSQTICAPTPLGRAIKVTLSGSGDTNASNLVIQSPALSAGSASFDQIIIGESVKDALAGQGFDANNDFTDPYGARSGQTIGNSFAQNANSASLTDIKQVGIGTEAGSFTVNGLKLFAEFTAGCG